MTGKIDYVALIEPVAVTLLGKPTRGLSTKTNLRFRRRGSMSVDLRKGVWSDKETNEGGGVIDLILREKKLSSKAECHRWLEEQGLIDKKIKSSKPNKSNGANGAAPHQSKSGEELPDKIKPGPIVDRYPYFDENGKLLFEVTKHDPKDFRQRRPDGRGGWINSLGKMRRVPYRLPELIEDIASKLIIFIVEGEKDVNNLRKLDVAATCNPAGAGKWKSANIDEHFKGANVVVVGDNDPQSVNNAGELQFHPDGRPKFTGQDHAQDVARHLSGVAGRVRVLDLKQAWPECPLKGDISDWIEVGGTAEALYEIANKLPDWEGSDEQSSPAIEIKIVSGQIARVVDEAEAGLITIGVPIMVRANSLVHPVVTKLPTDGGRTTEATLLRALRKENIVYALNKHGIVFKKFNGKSKEWLESDPPPEVATSLLHKGQWKFPRVAGVITVPTMRPDGTILDQPGYDSATQLWFAADSGVELPPIPEHPTFEQASQALALLDGLLNEFPFINDVDRSVALTAILTAVLRGAFPLTPMFLILAHSPGSGKSFLVNLTSNIVRGQDCPVITNCKSTQEMESRLGALLLEGAPAISLDNCSEDLGGDLLCQITEQKILRIRILGRSEMPQCEWRGVVYGTGNNIRLIGDMTRRGLICNIDPKLEQPEQRKFKIDPIKQVLSNRGAYVAAALTIARAYVAAGSPDVCGPLGSYGQWTKIVRSPLIWLGREDPVNSMEKAREIDPVRRAARTLVGLWKDNHLQAISYSAAEMIKAANEQRCVDEIRPGVREFDWKYPDLRDLLVEQAGNTHGDIDARRLGNWLASIEGQVHEGCRIELVRKSNSHGNRYALNKKVD